MQVLTPMQTFEEKVKSKLKETIADMLPEDALASLVQRAVEEQFFKPRQEQDRNSYHTVTKPSWFVGEVAKLAEPILSQHIAAAFEARKDEIEGAVKEFVSSQNLALLMVAAMSQRMSGELFNHANQIVDRIKRNY